MIVSLFRKNRHITIHLPQRINGQYWLEDLDEKGNNIKILKYNGEMKVKYMEEVEK